VEDTNPLDEGAAFSGSSELSDDYQLGPGDLIEVQVVGHDDMTQSVRVSNSGEISLSRIGLLKVADLTSFDVESLVASKIREKELIREPDVLVFIREYQSKPIYVSGAVVTAGEFVMSRELTVADAILLAGGLRFNAGDEAYLHRRVSLDAKSIPVADIASQPSLARAGDQVIKINLRPLKEGRFFEVEVPMKKGDVLVVPQRQMNSFFVVGDVIDPHNFVYPPGTTLMVSQAISWAQGPTPTAKMSEGMLVRYDSAGNRQESKVDYAAILSGRQPDFAIQPNDIIFIPGSVAKTISHGLVQATGVMIMQQSFRYGRQIEYSNRTSDALEILNNGAQR
jgi:polysaccharide export outer membrane protein